MQDTTFTKEQILKAKKYASRRDALRIILKENEEYTLKKVDSLLAKFMKGKVK